MTKIDIKALSVNEVRKGKRYKTKKYKSYEQQLLRLLPDIDFPERDIELYIERGFSNSGSDIDNPIKPFLDILQKKYGFNDRYITSLILQKTKVKKGQEFIYFCLIEGKKKSLLKKFLNLFNKN